MAGSGSWKNLLSNQDEEKFYGAIYPGGVSLSGLGPERLRLISKWKQADIVKIQDGRAVPAGPVMLDSDLEVLKHWFDDIKNVMTSEVKANLEAYGRIASSLANPAIPASIGNLLTIMICAHTLDSTIFSSLRRVIMGTYAPRGMAGDFFFWGYGFQNGPERIYGFTSYGRYSGESVHVIRSRGLNREKLKSVLLQNGVLEFIHQKAPGKGGGTRIEFDAGKQRLTDLLRGVYILDDQNPSRLCIPVFYGPAMNQAARLYQSVSEAVTQRFMDTLDTLSKLVGNCSFSGCLSSDVLCMLFHLAYSYAADDLVKEGVIPEFPESATGEWGVWIH
jgi:hypothetical protein